MPPQTPMIQQYLEVKSKHPDAILFYRLGDFYEMFFEDAEKASRLLNLTLTTRNKNQEDSVPLCGVPYHSASGYISKLVSLGHKVAICEQVEDPKKAKGIVKREVVQVVTPGLILDPDSLEGKNHNYLAGLSFVHNRWGVALADISTGFFRLTELQNEKGMVDELCRLEPSEILMEESWRGSPCVTQITKALPQTRLNFMAPLHFDSSFAGDIYKRYYHTALDGFGFREHQSAFIAGGVVLSYLSETKLLQDQLLSRPSLYQLSDFMILDANAKKNLELTKTLDGHSKGSLFWLLDKAQTVMGSRLLKNWLLYPLMDAQKITNRLDAVEELKNNPEALQDLRKTLANLSDLERIQNRVLARLAHARDLLALENSLAIVLFFKERLEGFQSSLLKEILSQLDPVEELTTSIRRQIVPDPPLALKEGGLIAEGVNPELDELRSLEKNGKYTIASMELREREATGISSLKIRYNKVFGYAIEVTHTHKNKVPSHYIRKQTLTQAERYITEELKEYEEKVLGAAERISELECKIFLQLREEASQFSDRIKKTAFALATLDVFCALAFVAEEYRYAKPQVIKDPVLDIKKGRHPIVEILYREEPFVPNDLFLNTSDNQLMVITGPNMAGKSTVMRQTALIALMAQIGSFVPAESATVGIVDRIFTRIGASDHLQKGQSTFMVEMLETAQIMTQATERSLIIMDEIGRGTSTFDGLSIAWAVAETLHDQIKSRTLFATHYHELTDLAEKREGIKNYHIVVKEWNGQILFLRELKAGGTNRSYGVFVAAMAGLPHNTIKRAREILRILEEKDLQFKSLTFKESHQMALFEKTPHPLIEEIKGLDLDSLTPLDALNFLAEKRKELK